MKTRIVLKLYNKGQRRDFLCILEGKEKKKKDSVKERFKRKNEYHSHSYKGEKLTTKNEHTDSLLFVARIQFIAGSCYTHVYPSIHEFMLHISTGRFDLDNPSI